MKKYESVISTRVPKMLADEMSHICDNLRIHESDFVRKSLANEIERYDTDTNYPQNRFQYI